MTPQQTMFNLLHDFYFSLNPDLLEDLKNHCRIESARLHEEGTTYNDYDLAGLIEKYSYKYPSDVALVSWVNGFKGCPSRSELYGLIDYMLSDIDI